MASEMSFENVDGPTADEGLYVYYKPTYETSAQVTS